MYRALSLRMKLRSMEEVMVMMICLITQGRDLELESMVIRKVWKRPWWSLTPPWDPIRESYPDPVDPHPINDPVY